MSENFEKLPEMPNFAIEDEKPEAQQQEPTSGPSEKKKPGRKKTCVMTDEDKRKRQTEYYEKNKQQRLEYKQALRGQHKVANNRCYLHTHYLPRYIKEEGSTRPRANIDWINWGGKMRTLTISQPTDELIGILKTHLNLNFEESSQGTPELSLEKKG